MRTYKKLNYLAVLVSLFLALQVSAQSNTAATKPVIDKFYPNEGPAGTKITVLGKNLTGATAVSVCGAPAKKFKVVSDTKLYVWVGGKDKGSDMVITTPGGVIKLGGYKYTEKGKKGK